MDPKFEHKLKPLKTFDRDWHRATDDANGLRERMKLYAAAYGRPEHNPQPIANAEIVKLTKRK